MDTMMGFSPTPPGCRKVSYSSWTRFSGSSAVSTPPGELKASLLWKADGLASCYDPPAGEWAYLGADQPVQFAKKPRRKGARQGSRGSSTWSITSEEEGFQSTPPMCFSKKAVKPVNTSSELTKSLRMCGGKQPSKRAVMMEKVRLENMKCENLPSAFDSDCDEDE